jgi:uncharacterized protein YneF (UPF0154 family)
LSFIALGIVLIAAGLYGPFYIGCKVLPDGWMEWPTTHWWTCPMILTLFACFIAGIIGGSVWIGAASNINKKDNWDL